MLQSSGKKRWSDGRGRNSRKISIRRCGKNFSARLQWRKGRIRLLEKYVSVTIQKTYDGVFIKREEGIQLLLTVLFEKQTENWYDKKKEQESYIVSNRK